MSAELAGSIIVASEKYESSHDASARGIEDSKIQRAPHQRRWPHRDASLPLGVLFFRRAYREALVMRLRGSEIS